MRAFPQCEWEGSDNSGTCSPPVPDAQIASIDYKLQHESLSLKEEKQLLREMQLLEASRPKVKEMEALSATVAVSLGQKDAIQERLKVRREGV